MGELDGRIALVAGASSGIGAATAKALARASGAADVLVWDGRRSLWAPIRLGRLWRRRR